MMSIEIIKIKLQGVLGCIDDYTDEPTISAIKDSLIKALSENNFEIILFSCIEIDKWYNKKINEILSNEYVYNKSEHKENCQLIKEIVNELEKNREKYIELTFAQKADGSRNAFGINDLMHLFDRFHQVVIQLRDRYDNRETLEVNDEYDVQDLLHSLLKIYFDDIRPEEWTPSYAGTSSRQDFLLKNEKIVIETKKARKGLNNKELANELIIDISRYKTHPDCKTLMCFVYDPENRIKNPRGLENDLTESIEDFNIIVKIRP